MRHKLIHIVMLLPLLLSPSALTAQDRPGARDLSATIRAVINETISDSLPVMEARLQAVLADSAEAMEGRIRASVGDTAHAAVAQIMADSLPAMEARLYGIMIDSLVVVEARLWAALGDSARAAVDEALADSLPVVEARLNQEIIDQIAALETQLWAALGDSARVAVGVALADSLPAMESRLMDWLQESVDTTGIGRLTLRVDTLMTGINLTDSLYRHIRLDSLCLVNLNPSRATYSNGVWTIPNDANKAAPAYMYGGLAPGVAGVDSSGVSRDSLTGRMTIALDGSAGDSVIVTLAEVNDSTNNFSVGFLWSPTSMAFNRKDILVLRYDTSGTNIETNFALNFLQLGDSLITWAKAPNNFNFLVDRRGGVFASGKHTHIDLVRNGPSYALYINAVLVYQLVSSYNLMRFNRVRLSGVQQGTSYKSSGKFTDIRLHSRALTSAERLTLYNNSLRGIQPPGPSAADVETIADNVAALRIDSLATASASEDSTLDARIDSVVTNMGGAGMDTSTVQALAAQLASDSLSADTLRNIRLGIPAADSSVHGIVTPGVAGETVTFGQVLYLKSDGKYWKAKADSILTMPVSGVVATKGSISASSTFQILRHGYIRCDAWNWSVGGQYPAGSMYVSAATAGLFTQTAPSATRNQVQFVGHAETADVIWFEPNRVLIGR